MVAGTLATAPQTISQVSQHAERNYFFYTHPNAHVQSHKQFYMYTQAYVHTKNYTHTSAMYRERLTDMHGDITTGKYIYTHKPLNRTVFFLTYIHTCLHAHTYLLRVLNSYVVTILTLQ